jgi:hypothetical protein
MRYLSFKIIAACILLPPVLYILTGYLIERYFQSAYADEIEAVYLGDTRTLLDGSTRIRETIDQNVERFLKTRRLIPLGLDAAVTVATKGGTVLYPTNYEQVGVSRSAANPTRMAQENFAILNEGLTVQVVTKFEHNRLLSNSILSIYIILALAIFYSHYRNATRRIDTEETTRRKEIDRLQHLERQNTNKLENLLKERSRLRSEFDKLKTNLAAEKSRALKNEDELIDEIDLLEKKLSEHLSLQDAQQEEISALQEELRQLQKGSRKSKKQKVKPEEAVRKRFAALYKNIGFHDRAISGFAQLNDDLKLKAEEVIHQLNADASLVSIKRKVFGGKGQVTVLEVIFGYKGRLYFRNTEDRRVEVLAVGTKNTQARELEFLSKL